MKFISTRGRTEPHSFSDAVAAGLAPDGGLFVPETMPDLSTRWRCWAGLGYSDLCAEFLAHFATDIPADELRAMTHAAVSRFDHPEIAPLRQLDAKVSVLELFHGPTLAFKDFALQLLGLIYERQCKLRGETLAVLGATSGDTGAAAIHGLLGKARASIFILYPDGRISPLQERQMACTGAANVHALAVDGSFDDAQRALKAVFGDREFAAKHKLSAVNSINLARILAQCVYYLYAWLRLPEAARADVEFVVPTGNFGNVLAGWMLREMGVPIPGFRVATNRNDILHRMLTRGDYSVARVEASHAPSMDIQVASNFERFLYFTSGRDAARVRDVLAEFSSKGAYDFGKPAFPGVTASRADDSEIEAIIRDVHARFGYVVDPHTACGFKDLASDRHSVVLATAHPAKFPDVIRKATGKEVTHPALEALKSLPVVKHQIAADAGAIRDYIAKHAG
jgi:threonine synthase